jgi:Hemerythrin HHE cation binding domain
MVTQGEPMADVRDMYMVHTVFRREFGLIPGLILEAPESDTRRSEVAGSHIDLMCRLLHAHHDGEDLILWPLLLDRGGEDAQAVVPTMQAQHAALDDAIGLITKLLGPWRSTARRGAPLAAACSSLNAAITEHMALEEERILPLAEKHVTASEWGRLGAHAMAQFSKNELTLLFGMSMYEADPEVIRGVLAEAPLQARLLVPRLAPRAYAKHARRVHGTPTPPRAASVS